jgi:hypothetical protein
MPINQALDVAAELRVLRDTLKQKQDELGDVNARRALLQADIASIQAAILLKRTELRTASSDL